MSVPYVTQETLAHLGEQIIADSAGAALSYTVEFGDLNLRAQPGRIVELLTLLRDSPAFRFQQLVDVTAVDFPERARRFDVVYHLLSLTKNWRVRISIETDEDTPVASITSVYPSADWFERETFDMFGVFFSGHPDLRRILTDYGFHGYPLRKDFPMTGYVEVRYDDALKRVVYEPVKLPQEFRRFDFLSPWEGAAYVPGQGSKYVLPGDEKAIAPPAAAPAEGKK